MKQYNILGGIDNLTEKQKKMITREEYLKALQLIYDYKEQVNNDVQNQIDVLNLINPNDYVKHHISTRLFYCLLAGEIVVRETKIKDFEFNLSKQQLMQFRNLGKKSYNEFLEFCDKINIKLN